MSKNLDIFKDRLREIVSKYRFQKEFCEKSGVSEKSLSKVLNGYQKSLNSNELGLLGLNLGINLTWLLTGEGTMYVRGHDVAGGNRGSWEDFIYVPLYDVGASAGGGTVVESEKIVDSLAFKRDWVTHHLQADPKNLILLSALGDSMKPTIQDDDLILLDISKKKLSGDGVYCFSNEDYDLVVKRLQVLQDGIVAVCSDNEQYQNFTLSGSQMESLRIIGKVVWVGRKF